MKLYSIEFTPAAEGNLVELKCPVCSAVWHREDPEEGSPREMIPCRHLRFLWYDEFDDGPEFYGRWGRKTFAKAYRKKVIEMYGKDEDPGEDLSYLDEDVLEAMECDQIDEVAILTESGMACGPVCHATYFGIKRDSAAG